MYLFEYDKRFDIYGKYFINYDFNSPTKFLKSQEFKDSFDFILADPPFLNEDCLIKTMMTVRWISKKKNCNDNDNNNFKLLIYTGKLFIYFCRYHGYIYN